MLLVEKLRCLEHLDYLISHQIRGTPLEIARRMGVSRATLYNYLHLLEEMGADIQYNKPLGYFYYSSEIKLNLGYIIKIKDKKI
ncbi:MAG: HTH domain-containing protein [Chitinophagaceae bacterium]